jgi:hypothetical protein
LSDTFPGYGWVIADATVAPDQARTIADAMKAVATALHDKGVTDGGTRPRQAARAHAAPRVRAHESLLARQRPGRRAGISPAPRLEPLPLHRQRERDRRRAERALAKQYLDPAKASVFIVVPAVRSRGNARREISPLDTPPAFCCASRTPPLFIEGIQACQPKSLSRVEGGARQGGGWCRSQRARCSAQIRRLAQRPIYRICRDVGGVDNVWW